MRVIACFPELEPDPEPAPAPVDPQPVSTATAEVAVRGSVRTLPRKVFERPRRTAAGVRFPARSVILLALVAASSWAGAWWNDHQRFRAERTLAAGAKRLEVADRPNRLARELPATGPAAEAVVP